MFNINGSMTYYNRSIALDDDLSVMMLITTANDPSYKSYNSFDKYPTMRHFVTEMCTHVPIFVTKCGTWDWYIVEFAQLVIYDDVTKWKHFPRYWPFVRGIPRRTKASNGEL